MSPAGAIRRYLTGIALLKCQTSVVNQCTEPCTTSILFSFADYDRTDVACSNLHLRVHIDSRFGFLDLFLPDILFKSGEVLKQETALKPGATPQAARAASMAIVRNRRMDHKRCFSVPTDKHQKARSQVFFQRSFTLVCAPAALEKRFPAQIQIKRAVRCVSKGKDTNVWMSRIHARTTIHEVHETIANAVFNAQEREVETSQRRTTGVDIDTNRGIRPEPVFPLRSAGKVVDILFVLVVGNSYTHQDAACRTAIETGTLRHEHGARKGHSATLDAHTGDTDDFQFLSANSSSPRGTTT